ncbi:MAG: family 16 glycoside hydrolase [Candidatus Promineifilaceae bacterium]
MSVQRWILGLAVLVLALSACDSESPATAVPLQPEDSGVLLSESFAIGDTADWFTEADDLGMTAVLNERMLVEVNAQNTIQYTTLQDRAFSNFLLEVEATQLAGSLESSYGVIFRMQSPDEFYRFDITGNGRFTVQRHDADGSWTSFVEDWPQSEAIMQGYNVTNLIRISATGPAVAVYVNGELLHQFSDATYAEGNIALEGGTFGQPGLSVSFDNLVVKRP